MNQSLTVTGVCKAFHYGKKESRFSGKHVLRLDSDGTINLYPDGMDEPCATISQAEHISIDRNLFNAQIEVYARSGREKLIVSFNKVVDMQSPSPKDMTEIRKICVPCNNRGFPECHECHWLTGKYPSMYDGPEFKDMKGMDEIVKVSQ